MNQILFKATGRSYKRSILTAIAAGVAILTAIVLDSAYVTATIALCASPWVLAYACSSESQNQEGGRK